VGADDDKTPEQIRQEARRLIAERHANASGSSGRHRSGYSASVRQTARRPD
jgi:hypothetical protein